MNPITELAINSVQKSIKSFCRFIVANDCGSTGSHQSGFYIPKTSAELFFETLGVKGENKDRFIKIKWQNDFYTDSRFIYYGTGTRNEYRLTRFGKGFPFLNDENIGDLLIISHIEGDNYEAYVLNTDDDIEDFFTAFNIAANETNKLIEKGVTVEPEDKLKECFYSYVNSLNKGFPSTIDLSTMARACFNNAYKINDKTVKSHPDKTLLTWLDAEYQLFKAIELSAYSDILEKKFNSLDDLISFSNTILNRRKSRAGKSLEYHLSEIFNIFSINYDAQGITEDYKKPDFIFPSIKSYHDFSFNKERLTFLASKTTCKDRWRQVINEANNITIKHLFTLQQGISKNQLNEMYKENVRLVVPKQYLETFPAEYRDKILPLENFVQFVLSKQS